MKKMREAETKAIVRLLETWNRPTLTWNLLKLQISESILNGEPSWSRQSLQADDLIKAAWDDAKVRCAERDEAAVAGSVGPEKLRDLQSRLAALQSRYDALLLRHRQLAYNASLLPGGTRLLLDPLPDNTPTQVEGAGGRSRRGT